MGRIKGHYEWDDDHLVPGQKREGGLHQNLYDSEGKLKGNARFVPDFENDTESVVVTETIYLTIEDRRRTPEEEALQQAVAELVSHWVDRGVAAARPVVEQWWRDTARPVLEARRAKVVDRRLRLKQKKNSVIEPSGERSRERADVLSQRGPDMSRAEAQARYLAALAARVYSEEQMRLVTSANIVDSDGVPALKRSLAELPPKQVARLIKAMATDPSKLTDDNLAQLASVIGRASQ